jgi:CRISPR type IV-associated protein Csf3
MRPFRVNWRFSQPICLSENRLHLDAILAWANVHRAIGDGMASAEALALQEALPLERVVGDAGEWIWKASSLAFTFSSPPFLVRCVRRTDIDTIAFARKSLIHTSRTQLEKGTGPYKNFDLRFVVQWVKSAIAYGVGEIDAVRELLSTVTSLGKLTRNGWGRISEFYVQEDQEAETRWQWRTLPQWIALQSFENYCPGNSTVRPPYWRREFQEPVWEYLG